MEDLQSLLEKINRDGVEKAEAEATRIIDAAKAKAATIIAEAKEAAAKSDAQAKQAADDYAARAAVTIKEGARDLIISIQASITSTLEKLLTQNVDLALADNDKVAALVLETVKSLSTTGEIACGAKLAGALQAQLAKLGNFTITTDNGIGAGFAVRLDNGRVEHAFTAAVIAEELAKRLRSDLAKLVK